MRISDWSSDVCSSDLLSVPILADKPFFEALTLDGAVRYSDYDLFGSDWNYKASLDWVINDSFRLRGTYGTGFRIPNVPELFGGVSEGNLTTTDPCSRYATSGNATLIANCQADRTSTRLTSSH